MATTSYSLAPGTSAEDLALKRKIALQLMQQGMDTSPVQHWAQGLARMGQSALGGYELHQAKQEDEKEREAGRQALMSMIPGGDQAAHPQGPITSGPRPLSAPPAFAPPPAPPGSTNERVATSFAAMSPQPSPTAPRGIRNNNPLNIEAGRFTQGQPGFAGSDGRFARFETPDQGVTAASNLLDVYGRQHGINTVAGVINRWAPASDGNPVNAYAQHVAKALGVGPTDPINLGDPAVRQRLVMAMGQFENGRPIQMPGAMPAGGAPAAPPQSMPMGASAAQPQITPQQRAQLTTLLGNRFTAPMAQQIITGLVQRGIMPADPKFEKIKDEYGAEVPVWVNPRTRSVEAAPIPAGARAPQSSLPVQAAPGQPQIPPPPPGVDPRAWRTEMTKRAAGEPIPAEAAGRLAMMDTAARDLPQARAVFERTWGSGDVAKNLAARAGIGMASGDVGQARRTVRSAIESALRVMTGAAAPETEVKRYEDLFMPNELDDIASAKQKLDMLESFMANARTNVMQGRTLPGSQPQSAPQSQASAPQASRTINGKTYVKINGQWFEQ